MEKKEQRAKKVKAYYDRIAHPLTQLQVGNHVVIQHPTTKCWSTPGVVVEIGPNRDYLVKSSAGRIFRRNRRFIRRRFVTAPPARIVQPAAATTPPPTALIVQPAASTSSSTARIVQPAAPTLSSTAWIVQPAATIDPPTARIVQPAPSTQPTRQSGRTRGPKDWKYPEEDYVIKQ